MTKGETMEFDSSRPIWQQLCEEFTRLIVTGQWAGGTKVPSVRELALHYGVNPNTVQRACAELDREGITISERTSGRFVTHDSDLLQQARKELAHTTVIEFVEKMKGFNLNPATVTQLIQNLWETRSTDA